MDTKTFLRQIRSDTSLDIWKKEWQARLGNRQEDFFLKKME
jgi:hypothetical protein